MQMQLENVCLSIQFIPSDEQQQPKLGSFKLRKHYSNYTFEVFAWVNVRFQTKNFLIVLAFVFFSLSYRFISCLRHIWMKESDFTSALMNLTFTVLVNGLRHAVWNVKILIIPLTYRIKEAIVFFFAIIWWNKYTMRVTLGLLSVTCCTHIQSVHVKIAPKYPYSYAVCVSDIDGLKKHKTWSR